jgi:hypothetical protein
MEAFISITIPLQISNYTKGMVFSHTYEFKMNMNSLIITYELKNLYIDIATRRIENPQHRIDVFIAILKPWKEP